jgi:signal transduction histidine kinase
MFDMNSPPVEDEGELFQVACAKTLTDYDCSSFITIPLLNDAEKSNAGDRTKQRAAVCLHYKNGRPICSHPDVNLILLGRLTALKITAAFEADKKRVLLQLNQLTQDCLADSTGSPEDLRKDYSQKLLPIIKEHVRAKWVSLFYRDYQFNYNKAFCLSSTGLCGGNGNPVNPARLAEVRYEKGQGITGRIFENGDPLIAKIGEYSYDTPPYYGELPPSFDRTSISWMILPIRKRGVDGESVQLGVLRCVETDHPIAGERFGNFSQQQAEIMDFISKQIAPVLETFEKQVARENQIAIVRHDLADPIKAMLDNLIDVGRFCLQKGLIEDRAAARTEDTLKSATKKSDTDFPSWLQRRRRMNLRYEVSNLLVQQRIISQVSLELNEREFLHYEPRRAYIVTDVIAPLASVYWMVAQNQNEMGLSFSGFENYKSPLYFDPVQIQRVLVNLLTNAIKYGRKGSTIEVLPLDILDGFGVVVSNEGEGIPENEVERIFEGQYRTPWAQTKASGAGLGLKISRAIMQRHGGDLVVRHNCKPTEFMMIFPNILKTSPVV